jgi:hypothetical protein
MIRNTIRIEDTTYLVRRILSNTTSEEDARRIHEYLETDTLLRDKEGSWFCCNKAVDVDFNDIEKNILEEPKIEESDTEEETKTEQE